MTAKLFLILMIATQALFLALDFMHAYLHRKKGSAIDTRSLRRSSIIFLIGVIILYGVIQFGTMALMPQTERVISLFTEMIPSIPVVDLGGTLSAVGWVLLGIIAFYVSGFWDYAIHRFVSHSRSLFFTHEYHHLPNRLFLALPGLSVRPFVIVAVLPATLGTLLCIVIILKAFALGSLSIMPMVYVIVFIQSMILAITHSEFFMGQWWMYRWFRFFAITSPQEHEMHHTVDLRGNYGNFTMLYDRLFDTYIDPTKPENKDHALGLSYDQDYLGALTAGKIKLSKALREKYQVGEFCNIVEQKSE